MRAIGPLAMCLGLLGCSPALETGVSSAAHSASQRGTTYDPRPGMQSDAQQPFPQPFQVGSASYYTDRLTGHPTATGEPYDPGAFTAAHRSLPLGSIVDVVRPDGRLVRVRINDRGPYVDGRIIDLSKRAAATIGMLRDGTAEVALWLVYVPPPSPKRQPRSARR